MQPYSQLLPHLTQILPQRLRLLSIPRRLECLVQRKPGLPRYTKLFQRTVYQRFLSGPLVHVGFDFGEAVGDEKDAVDEHAVGRTLDLEVAEERVGAEEGEDLIEAVV